MRTMFVPDGYNGHMVEVSLDHILDETKHTVQLRVAEKGKENMTRWLWKTDLPIEAFEANKRMQLIETFEHTNGITTEREPSSYWDINSFEEGLEMVEGNYKMYTFKRTGNTFISDWFYSGGDYPRSRIVLEIVTYFGPNS